MPQLLPNTLERIDMAIELVRQRLLRFTRVLEEHNIPYAVVGGNAVAAWVSQVDPEAVRATRDVDILIHRVDLPRVTLAVEPHGFTHREVYGVDLFLDGPDAKPSQAVHIVFTNEKVKQHETVVNPGLDHVSHSPEGYRIIDLQELVQIKLTAFRIKDQTHLIDLINIGLVDRSWINRYPPELAKNLEYLFNLPDTDPDRPRY